MQSFTWRFWSIFQEQWKNLVTVDTHSRISTLLKKRWKPIGTVGKRRSSGTGCSSNLWSRTSPTRTLGSPLYLITDTERRLDPASLMHCLQCSLETLWRRDFASSFLMETLVRCFQLSWQCLERPRKGASEHACEEGEPLKGRQHHFKSRDPVLNKTRTGENGGSHLLLPDCRSRLVDSSSSHYGFSNRIGCILQLWANTSPSLFKLFLPGLFYHSRRKATNTTTA